MGLYVAGGVSAGAGSTFLATKLMRKRPEPAAPNTSTETQGDNHATTDDRIEG
jgi:formate-dependent nitrite reductase membrane component NrfD